MKGRNTIMMNQETINNAVEHYLNTCVFAISKPVRVLSVKSDNNKLGPEFEVVVKSINLEADQKNTLLEEEND